MTVTTHDDGPVTIFRLQGKMMSENDTTEFLTALKEALLEGRRHFVLDFSGVDWINSSGLGALIAGNGLVREIQGQYHLAALNDSVQQVLTTNKLHLIFDIHLTAAAAAERLKMISVPD